MFEKVIPHFRANGAVPLGENGGERLLVGTVDSVPGGAGGALRALEWTEVTARLNAARDLRLLMRRDFRHNIECGASSFGDAAATYFRALEDDERPVNLDALEPCKASSRIGCEPYSDAATSDARDD